MKFHQHLHSHFSWGCNREKKTDDFPGHELTFIEFGDLQAQHVCRPQRVHYTHDGSMVLQLLVCVPAVALIFFAQKKGCTYHGR